MSRFFFAGEGRKKLNQFTVNSISLTLILLQMQRLTSSAGHRMLKQSGKQTNFDIFFQLSRILFFTFFRSKSQDFRSNYIF